MVSEAAFTERVIVQPLTEGVFIHPVEEDQEHESLDAAIHHIACLFALKKGSNLLHPITHNSSQTLCPPAHPAHCEGAGVDMPAL